MTLLALWYYHSAEGRRFLEGRDIRLMLVAAGVVAAYILLRTRPRFSHEQSRWWTVARMLTSAVIAAALWLGVDLVRGEDWISQLLGSLPELHENGIRYSLLIMAGWLGWSDPQCQCRALLGTLPASLHPPVVDEFSYGAGSHDVCEGKVITVRD